MSQLVKELNNLDFSSYIGGPLQAAISAQTSAALATVDFIQKVGFTFKSETVNGVPTMVVDDIKYVTFNYKKTDPSVQQGWSEYTLKVPFLTMVPIPYIRIDEITIDFSAKLTSCETSDYSSEWGLNVETGVNFGRMFNFKAAASYKSKSSSGSEVNRSYDLMVHVRAVSEEIPAGLDRILRLVESEIKEDKSS